MSHRLYIPDSVDDATDPGDLVRHCETCERSYIYETRDTVTQVDGACSNNGYPNARAGIGVFVCCTSPLNISAPLVDGLQTNQRAEIRAATAAVELVSQLFLDGAFRGTRCFKGVILMTDSACLVSAMTDWVYKWKRNGWKTSIGRPVVNMEDFVELDRLVQYLEQNRVPVRFWRIAREHNTFADRLAKAAIGL